MSISRERLLKPAPTVSKEASRQIFQGGSTVFLHPSNICFMPLVKAKKIKIFQLTGDNVKIFRIFP
jgi:hypothetical protein